MKKIIFLLLFLSSSLMFSQKEAAIWYFGGNAGLDFNSGVPVPLLDGKLHIDEGTATISDSDGKLLFYTDGMTVYNKNHEIMLNGEELKGHSSSTTSAIIVPAPGNPKLYYIFTADIQFQENGMQYSVVDMSLDNNLGGISVKNVMLEPIIAEKLTAIKVSGENAFWVIAHRGHSNEFIAFKITSAGINPNPVVSAAGPFITWPDGNSIGQMKLSPDGKKLAVATQDMGYELYDFNTATGKITNFRQLLSGYGSYGIEFSPNSNLLYTSSHNGFEGVSQYNLLAGTLQDIIDSKISLFKDETTWAMQLGIDGKIYIATSNFSEGYLDVINYPNKPGIDSEYKHKGQPLGDRVSKLGLPPFIQSFFYISGITAENLCFGETTKFSVSASTQFDLLTWNFGDGKTSNLLTPDHRYNNPGTYIVKVTIISNGETFEETKEVIIYHTPVANAVKDVTICSSDGKFTFDLTSLDREVLGTQDPQYFKIDYFLNSDNAEKNQSPLSTQLTQSTILPEFLYARISNNGRAACYKIIKFRISVYKEPKLKNVSDWDLCSPSGSYQFNFSEKDAEVMGAQDPDDFSVLYFISEQNALDNRGKIASITVTEHNNSPTEIFYRIQNKGNAACFKTGKFKVSVTSGIPVNHALLFAACNETQGFGQFNINTWKAAVFTGDPAGIEFKFFNSAGAPLDISQTGSYRNKIPFSETIRVELRDANKPLCVAQTEISLVVNKLPEWTLQDTYTICGLDPFLEISTTGNYDTWEWKYKAQVISSSAGVRLVEEGDYTFRGTKTENGITCEVIEYVRLHRSALPQITEVVFKEWSGNNYIEICATGAGELEYSIDGINFTTGNYFDRLPGGLYTAIVRDKKGCGIDEQQVLLLDFPKYFTPNNDGYNDLWQITEISKFPNSIVQIYDRFGKLLLQLNHNDKGWDGNFMNRQMPADDYWFSLKLENGTIYKNHFSLVR